MSGASARSGTELQGAIPGPTRPARRLAALDGFRAVLLGLVMAYHAIWTAPAYAEGWVPGGWLGVDGFFVLSGFLICGLLVNEVTTSGRVRYFRFIWRRVLRLYPSLLVVLGVVGAVSVFANGTTFARTWPSLLNGSLSLRNWPIKFGGPPVPELGHLWSLGLEFQFYLVFPLVVIVLAWLKARPAAWIATFGTLLAASAIVRSVLYTGPESLPGPYEFTYTRMDGLLWGAVAAMLVHAGRVGPRAVRALRVAGPVAVLFLAWAMSNVSTAEARAYDWVIVTAGLAAAVLILWFVTDPGQPLARALSSRPATFLGVRSYGAYLWHFPTFFVVKQHLGHLHGPTRVMVAMSATLVLADVTHRLVERPMFGVKDRLVPRHVSPPSHAPANASDLVSSVPLPPGTEDPSRPIANVTT